MIEEAVVPTELGPHNPRLERVRGLRSPRGRRDAGAFAVEGALLLGEAERSGLRPREVYATAEGLERIDAAALEAAGVPVYVLGERPFARVSNLETPTGVLAVLPLPAHRVDEILARPGVVLLLAGVADPGNAGTLVRSAEAFGAAGVLFGTGSADVWAPKVVRAAMGSLFRVPVAAVEPDRLSQAAAQAGRTLVATELEGEDLRSAGSLARTIVAIGNERRGVRDWLPRWDRSVRIPHVGPAESLNAAVAGSIVLYEAARHGASCQDSCQPAERP